MGCEAAAMIKIVGCRKYPLRGFALAMVPSIHSFAPPHPAPYVNGYGFEIDCTAMKF